MVGEAPTSVFKRSVVGRLPRPRGLFRTLRHNQRGTAVVEFALVAPILFLLVFGILDFGRALNYYNQLTQLSGQGARAAVVDNNPDGTGPASGTSIQSQLAGTYATGGLRNGVQVCINSVPAVGQPVTVVSTYKFTFLPLIGAALGSPTITLSATQSERQEATPTYSSGCSP
jgi:Flp pilus assembly protein TadG